MCWTVRSLASGICYIHIKCDKIQFYDKRLIYFAAMEIGSSIEFATPLSLKQEINPEKVEQVAGAVLVLYIHLFSKSKTAFGGKTVIPLLVPRWASQSAAGCSRHLRLVEDQGPRKVGGEGKSDLFFSGWILQLVGRFEMDLRMEFQEKSILKLILKFRNLNNFPSGVEVYTNQLSLE
ncbi:hypothetical protein WN51_03339 [Melipona quadrifasciata]|uniref:Uncharacterized protein n=1 Tax=Melipona quadrifasciata TaxID=166423 RepID=A0A0M8ZTM9_9HYME|nr:hypothetical protein WN51_03339 [Melipona quadrifasciata]